jgi:dienelactone hydrolase
MNNSGEKMKQRFDPLSFVIVFMLVVICSNIYTFAEVLPPEQPLYGPGGKDYSHYKVTKNVYGEGIHQYWIFEPSNPTPESAPLIVFNHGWGAVNPRAYGGWIEHIVRRGNIVIYPRYQEDQLYPPDKITENAIYAVNNAIKQLLSKGHVKPELDKFAIVGHSAGGIITANMAALTKSSGLPEPKAIMCVQPGKSWNKIERTRIQLEDLSKIPESIFLLTVVGDKDDIAYDVDAKRIFNETPQIPAINKDFVIIVSDDHGNPALIANHYAPCALNEAYGSGERRRDSARQGLGDYDFIDFESGSYSIDALDYYGFWKLFDGLYDFAFFGKNMEYALGNTPEQRYMGKWSDGVPVKELMVTDNP